MIKIRPPIKHTMNMKTLQVQCWFDHENALSPNGMYQFFGGITFPTLVKAAETGIPHIVGYAMMLGKHSNGTMYVFDETEWYMVNHVTDMATGAIVHEGIVEWINGVWQRYYARTFGYRQDDDTLFRYILDFDRCTMVEPKPDFYLAEWDDDAQPQSIIDQARQQKRLYYPKESVIFRQLEEQAANTDSKSIDYPAVHALRCCLATMDRYYH